jgi:hypothetical protein
MTTMTAVLLILMPVALWCTFVLIREEGLTALVNACPITLAFAIAIFVPLFFDVISSQPSVAGGRAIGNLILWVFITASICPSMVLTAVMMTIYRNRKRIHQLFPPRADHV